jgi:hypothetical protein
MAMSWREEDDIERRVIDLVAAHSGRDPSSIGKDAELERDLGFTGDGATALLGWMQREFDIDMSAFQFDRHFDNQGSPGWPTVVAAVVSLPITVVLMIVIGMISQATGVQVGRSLGPAGLLAAVYLVCVVLIGLATIVLPIARARRRRKMPLTVQVLIYAARDRKWPLSDLEGDAK